MEDFVVPVMQQNTLSSQVIRFLLGLISEKRLKVGDVVPSEVKVSEMLQVSRGIVRESYRALATVGVLSVQSGKRPRIREMDPTVLAQFFAYAAATSQINAQQIFELRRVIEMQAAVLATKNGTDEDLMRIREAGKRLHDYPISHPEWIACDYALHIAIADAVHNPLFQIIIRALRAPLEESMREGIESQVSIHTEIHIVALHDQIVEAICNRDAVAASKAIEEHFNAPVSALLKKGIININ
ncbi:MAG: hypothetical protein H6R07_1461 [Proteobacteria bacterium]|nr:hypothetical protein [Pseudomonadota bacterium]